jgi:hypothetical protein
VLTVREPTPGGQSVFSLVETTHFKQLTHLAFATRSGTDASTKRYLAARLRQVKSAHAAALPGSV